jgi:hypothetical protein
MSSTPEACHQGPQECPSRPLVHHVAVTEGSLPVSVLLITGTVGAGKTALAREVGELLRLARLTTGHRRQRFAAGVIDLMRSPMWRRARSRTA